MKTLGTMGAISTPALIPASTNARTAPQALQGVRRPRFQLLPGVFVNRRDAHVDGVARDAPVLDEHVDVADDHRALGDQAERRAVCASAPQSALRDSR